MVKTICVCGAGTMGSGIAQLAAQAGYTTIQYDLNEEMLEKSRQSISSTLQSLVNKGRITTAQQTSALNCLHFTSNIQDCKADVVIEAIIEKHAAKVELFNQLSEVNSSNTIFASNTSSLSIAELAHDIPEPGRFAGMHFFNPAPLMKLVEIVKGEMTSAENLNTLIALAKVLGKTPVVCKDAPGFIVNRVARQYYLEAMALVEEGVADIQSVDKVLEAAGFKMGPFKLMDLIGLDVNYNVSTIVWNALDQPVRLTPSDIQKQKVAVGELGRKTGKGFYNYT